MKEVTLHIPDDLEMDDHQIAMLVASRLFEQGKLSLGQAAELAGLTKKSFAELLGNFSVSIFNYPTADLASDIANA